MYPSRCSSIFHWHVTFCRWKFFEVFNISSQGFKLYLNQILCHRLLQYIPCQTFSRPFSNLMCSYFNQIIWNTSSTIYCLGGQRMERCVNWELPNYRPCSFQYSSTLALPHIGNSDYAKGLTKHWVLPIYFGMCCRSRNRSILLRSMMRPTHPSAQPPLHQRCSRSHPTACRSYLHSAIIPMQTACQNLPCTNAWRKLHILQQYAPRSPVNIIQPMHLLAHPEHDLF